MTLPERQSLVPKIDSVPPQWDYETNYFDYDDDEDEDEDDSLDYDDGSCWDEEELESHKERPAARVIDCFVRGHQPFPEECKLPEAESLSGHELDGLRNKEDEYEQREIFHDHNVYLKSTTRESYCEMPELKTSNTLVQQQMAIWQQIQDDNARKHSKPSATSDTLTSPAKRLKDASHTSPAGGSLSTAAFSGQQYSPPTKQNFSSSNISSSVSHTHVAVPPPPSLIYNNGVDLTTLFPGHDVKVLQTTSVEEAHKNGETVKVTCVGCKKGLLAAKMSTMIFCPCCGTLAPLMLTINTTDS